LCIHRHCRTKSCYNYEYNFFHQYYFSDTVLAADFIKTNGIKNKPPVYNAARLAVHLTKD